MDPKASLVYCGASGDCTGANAGKKCAANEACIAGKCKEYIPQWGTASALGPGSCNASTPQVAVNPSGSAMAVWQQSSGLAADIHASRYSASTGSWGAATVIDSGTNKAYEPQVAMDSSGRAMAAWNQANTYSNVYANLCE